MEESWKDKEIVASIDFGTAFSGIAFSLRKDYKEEKTKILTHEWETGEGLNTLKTPTSLLLDVRGKFCAFGYAAEEEYMSLCVKKQQKDCYYFRRFKMDLYKHEESSPINVNTRIKDVNGKEIRAIDVFRLAIEHLKTTIADLIKDRCGGGMIESSICYVLTTPAIWSEGSKHFMRMAAIKAGIPDERLRIALEPECAAVYVKSMGLPVSSEMKPGTLFMVVDLGGGTVDITVQTLNEESKFVEIIAPLGGPFGADNINRKFEDFLISLVGAKVFLEFRTENGDDYLDIIRLFEHKKRAFKDDGKETIIRVPQSFRDLHSAINSEDLAKSIKNTKHSDSVFMDRDKIRLNNNVMKSFFETTVKQIIELMEDTLKSSPEEIRTIMLVGGFADCVYLKKVVKDRFRRQTVLKPPEAVASVLKGAIIFGRDTSEVNTRVCKFTYGLDWNEEFDPKHHPMQRREETEDGYVCKDVFYKLIGKGERVKPDGPPIKIEAFVKSKYQEKIEFPFYRSEINDAPDFIDDTGCHHIGTLTVILPRVGKSPEDKSVMLHVYFGATELRAEAVDNLGTRYEVSFNLF